MRKGAKKSAGLLMFRESGESPEVFLVHPGGPYWAKKDEGVWTLPKGECDDGEEPLEAARREFLEETGFVASGHFVELGSIRQKSGKVVMAWAFAGDCDPSALLSNTYEIEWPPRSKKRIVIPEVDRGAWFSISSAHIYAREEQRPFLLRLQRFRSAPIPEELTSVS
jgi:predicted NUDIX family NTP pyrophosphohydrolase